MRRIGGDACVELSGGDAALGQRRRVIGVNKIVGYARVLRLGGKFLRVSKGPAAGLYGSQLLNAGRHADFRALSRLPLLPPLAISAFLAYRFTGNDKGVW